MFALVYVIYPETVRVYCSNKTYCRETIKTKPTVVNPPPAAEAPVVSNNYEGVGEESVEICGTGFENKCDEKGNSENRTRGKS